MKEFLAQAKNTAYGILILILVSCSPKPKVIEAESDMDVTSVFTHPEPYIDVEQLHENTQPSAAAVHKVKALETLPTMKYSYLKVQEGDRIYWLATKKMDVTIGATYYYSKGLLKTNFESKEYGRTFDSLYLVSQVVSANHGQKSENEVAEESSTIQSRKESTYTPEEGYLSIKQLVTAPEKYEGKFISLKGTCSKINLNIMGKNWIHLQDGSKDDYDLVITSKIDVPIGHALAIRGKVTLKKDFGSGYYYDIIVEDGELNTERGS